MKNNLLNWLSTLTSSNISIYTLENPGWLVSLNDYNNSIAKGNRKLYELEESAGSYWLQLCESKNRLYMACSSKNLLLGLMVFKNYFEHGKVGKLPSSLLRDSLLDWLQSFYSRQCNGEWEQLYGIKINSKDGGWFFEVDLDLTLLKEKKFTELKIDRSKNDWIICRVKDYKFVADCGSKNLEEVIGIFRKWVESH